MAGKYSPIYTYLKNISSGQREINFTFEQIECIINDKLPYSARAHRAWWANENVGSHVQAQEWMGAGWRVESVDLNRKNVKMIRNR